MDIINIGNSLEMFYRMDLTALLRELVDIKVIGEATEVQIVSCLNNFAAGRFDESYGICKIVLDFIWEQLNQGHWKDVNMSWRYAYTIISIVKALGEYALLRRGESKVTFGQIMKSVDMGLLMGAPVADNILARLCSHLREDYHKVAEPQSELSQQCSDMKENKLISDPNVDTDVTVKRQKLNQEQLVGSMTAEKLIEKVVCPSLETFRRDYYATETPVIITNAMEGWPALSIRKWTLDYIKQIAGYRTVPIELGSKYTDESWSQKLMTIQEFVERCIERKTGESDIGYLAQHQLFNQIPELQDDILIPDYCYLGDSEDVDINAWFGPKGTVSPVHYDPKHNFLSQVIGEKYIRIFPYLETDKLYPHDTTLLKNTSQVDIENPDTERFPRYKDAKYVECVLKSGEMLYIPPKFWHFVKSRSVSFSVSFWWE